MTHDSLVVEVMDQMGQQVIISSGFHLGSRSLGRISMQGLGLYRNYWAVGAGLSAAMTRDQRREASDIGRR